MRITHNIVRQGAVAALQTNQRRLYDTQAKVTSGLRFQRASEDPVAASESMRSGSSLRALEQYTANVDRAIGRVAAEEGALDTLTNVVERARELAVAQSGSNANAATRRIAKAEVDQLLDQALALGNTEFGGAYLFGGDYASERPFAKVAAPAYYTFNGATGAPRTEISAGEYVSPVHDATRVFQDTGVLAALRDLSVALGADDAAGVQASLPALAAAHDDIQSVLGEVGANTNRLEVTRANLDALEVTLRTFKSDLEEVDLEQALSELVGRQTAYQAAMMSTSRVLSMNLTDYLR